MLGKKKGKEVIYPTRVKGPQGPWKEGGGAPFPSWEGKEKEKVASFIRAAVFMPLLLVAEPLGKKKKRKERGEMCVSERFATRQAEPHASKK